MARRIRGDAELLRSTTVAFSVGSWLVLVDDGLLEGLFGLVESCGGIIDLPCLVRSGHSRWDGTPSATRAYRVEYERIRIHPYSVEEIEENQLKGFVIVQSI